MKNILKSFQIVQVLFLTLTWTSASVAENLDELLSVDKSKWLDECELIEEHYANFGTHLPKELAEEFVALKNRLK